MEQKSETSAAFPLRYQEHPRNTDHPRDKGHPRDSGHPRDKGHPGKNSGIRYNSKTRSAKRMPPRRSAWPQYCLSHGKKLAAMGMEGSSVSL